MSERNQRNATPSVIVVVAGPKKDLTRTKVVAERVNNIHKVIEKLTMLVKAHQSDTWRKNRWS